MTKRQLKSTIEELYHKLDEQWQTNQDIVRNLNTQLAQIRSQVLADANNGDGDPLIIEQINKNIIPSEYAWTYWKDINDLDDYWVGRYMKIIPMTSKLNRIGLMLCMKMGIMYGGTGYDTSTDKPYYLYRKDNKLYGYEIVDLLKYDNRPQTVGDNQDKIKWNTQPNFNKLLAKELNPLTVVEFNWRIGGVGDYIWCLKEMMEFIYLKQVLVSNTTGLITPYFLNGNSISAMKKLAKELMNPLQPVKAKIRDTGSIENSNLLGSDVEWTNLQLGKSNQQDIILTLKYIQEQSNNKWGIPITSSKNQTLSADANLSISTAETTRHVHDELVLNFLNQIFKLKGLETLDFEVFYDIENMVPQGKRSYSYEGKIGNENADKDGEGIANTNGGKLEEKQ